MKKNIKKIEENQIINKHTNKPFPPPFRYSKASRFRPPSRASPPVSTTYVRFRDKQKTGHAPNQTLNINHLWPASLEIDFCVCESDTEKKNKGRPIRPSNAVLAPQMGALLSQNLYTIQTNKKILDVLFSPQIRVVPMCWGWMDRAAARILGC